MPRTNKFSAQLGILPAAQRGLWLELSCVPDDFVLYGGTALALHLGHRNSVDFNFFSDRPLRLAELETNVPFISGAKIIQREENTLSAIVDRGGPVKVSFFGVPKLQRLSAPQIAADNNLKVASLIDLAGTQASVVQVRAEAKDYIDMDALMRLGSIGLPMALAAAQRLYGTGFNPEVTLKALSYFGDGNLVELPNDLKLRLITAARQVDLDQLPDLNSALRRDNLDYGSEL